MFGYIKPYQSELKMGELELYKGVYCGLCKKLGKVYGPFARMTLSYDFTFLSLVILGLSDTCGGFRREACAYNPFKKKLCLRPCEDLTFPASVAMILFYHKLYDNIHDNKGFKKLGYCCLAPFFKSALKKASKRYPDIHTMVSDAMQLQRVCEVRHTASIDEAAHPSASILGEVMQSIGSDENQKRVLQRFGYLLGRWVYLIDALDDLYDDLKAKRYNPLIYHFSLQERTSLDQTTREAVYTYAEQAINLTAGELSAMYELLEWKRYKSILDNIIYLGLAQVKQTTMQAK